MFPIISIGPLAIQAPGLILILSLWVGLWLSGRLATSLGTAGDTIENGILLALLIGIPSARLGFVFQNLPSFKDNLLAILSLTTGMLLPSFGILAGLLTLIIYFQKKNLPALPTLDSLTPLIIMVFLGFHLANFASGEGYGLPTSVPWGITLWNASRHPVQLYAVILSLILLGWLMIQTRLFKRSGFMRRGVLTAITVAGLSIITVFTRAFVAQREMLFNSDPVQLLSMALLAGALFAIFRWYYSAPQNRKIWISLGSNHNPQDHIKRALEILEQRFNVASVSSLYQSDDVTGSGGGQVYLNQVVGIESDLPYPEILDQLKEIELQLGRNRHNKEQVAIDLDILTYGHEVFVHKQRHIPDSGLAQYPYLLVPLLEVDPEFRHPATGKTALELLDAIDNEKKQTLIRLAEVTDGTER